MTAEYIVYSYYQHCLYLSKVNSAGHYLVGSHTFALTSKRRVKDGAKNSGKGLELYALTY